MTPGRTRTRVRVTANFEANLAAVEAYWVAEEASEAYARLLDELTDTVLPNLERYPQMGRPFLPRRAHSVEALEAASRLADRLGAGELRGDQWRQTPLRVSAESSRPTSTASNPSCRSRSWSFRSW